MKKQLIVMITVFVVMMFFTSLMGQEPHKEIRIKKMVGGCAMGLQDLTEEQQNTIRDLQLTMKKNILPLKSELEIVSAELKRLMISDNPEKSAIMKKVEAISALKMKIQKLRIEHQLKIRAILTPEQRIQFDEKVLHERGDMEWREDMPGDRKIRKLRFLGEPGSDIDEDVEMEIEEVE